MGRYKSEMLQNGLWGSAKRPFEVSMFFE
jgi:hypothetical protein